MATYTGLFDYVLKIFAATPTARLRRYDAGRFTFNVAKGRCGTCEGEGWVFVAGSWTVPHPLQASQKTFHSKRVDVVQTPLRGRRGLTLMSLLYQIAVKAIGINRAEVMFRNHAYLQEASFPIPRDFHCGGQHQSAISVMHRHTAPARVNGCFSGPKRSRREMKPVNHLADFTFGKAGLGLGMVLEWDRGGLCCHK